MRTWPLLWVLVCVFGSTAGATLVAPPTLDELVARADLVFEGTVADVRSSWREAREGRAIMSDVTFRVIRTFKGDPSPQVVLELFGGTVGKDMMRIAGMPAFVRGDHDVLFVRRRDGAGLPIVGLMHGRFKVARTPPGHEMVTMFDGRAIDSVSAIGSSPRPRAEVGSGLTLADFAAEVAQRVRSRNAVSQ